MNPSNLKALLHVMLVKCERGEREGVNIKPKSRRESTDEILIHLSRC